MSKWDLSYKTEVEKTISEVFKADYDRWRKAMLCAENKIFTERNMLRETLALHSVLVWAIIYFYSLGEIKVLFDIFNHSKTLNKLNEDYLDLIDAQPKLANYQASLTLMNNRGILQ